MIPWLQDKYFAARIWIDRNPEAAIGIGFVLGLFVGWVIG